jgi:hypothetical protein
MKVYLGKDRMHVTALDSNPCHLTELTRKVEKCGQKLYMDNFFSLFELFDEVTTKSL